jgi:hypothetical protein
MKRGTTGLDENGEAEEAADDKEEERRDEKRRRSIFPMLLPGETAWDLQICQIGGEKQFLDTFRFKKWQISTV